MKSFSEIADDIKKAKGLKTDQEIADLFGWTRQAVNNYRKDNRIPFKQLVDFCENNDVSLDWLLLGREAPKTASEIDDLKKLLKSVEKKLK